MNKQPIGAFQTIGFFVTAPSTTLTAVTAGTGDSLTLKNSPGRIRLLGLGGKWQTAGEIQVTSTRMHDAVRGITAYSYAAENYPLTPQVPQSLESQDTLSVKMSGSGTGGDIEIGYMQIYYENLPGSNGRFITPQELEQYRKLVGGHENIVVNKNTLSLGTSGQYSGEVALNSDYDLLKANTDYALVGYTVSALCGFVGIRGTDTGNIRIGMPGNEKNKDFTRNYFIHQSRQWNLPLIPVINSANKANTLIDGMQDENGTDVIVNLWLVELM